MSVVNSRGNKSPLLFALNITLLKPLDLKWSISAVSWLTLQEDKLLCGWQDPVNLDAVASVPAGLGNLL